MLNVLEEMRAEKCGDYLLRRSKAYLAGEFALY
jgi:hypothetical protein